MSNQGDYEILNCYRAIYYVPVNTDYMFVRHSDSKDKKTLFVRCRAYVSVSYSKHYQFLPTKTFYGSLSKNFCLFFNSFSKNFVYSLTHITGAFALRVFQEIHVDTVQIVSFITDTFVLKVYKKRLLIMVHMSVVSSLIQLCKLVIYTMIV